jgi:predicted dehydrogenase
MGFLGAGNFATSMLLAHLKARRDVRLTGVVTASGLDRTRGGGEVRLWILRFGRRGDLLRCGRTDAVFVVTRHHLHADYAARALEAGKAVFVEKPLATTAEELERVIAAAEAGGDAARLLVGFNRRFAPLSRKLAAHFPQGDGPLIATYRVNAGFLGRESWYQDPAEGGGRILGEVCHFLDYIAFLAKSPITRVYASGVRDPKGACAPTTTS